jgi:hypothetical protein
LSVPHQDFRSRLSMLGKFAGAVGVPLSELIDDPKGKAKNSK